MSNREIERQVRDLFAGPLSERGFAPEEDVTFVRKHSEAVQSISFPYEARHAPHGTRRFRFNVDVWNRFPVLERLYAPEDDVARFAPAVTSPLYLLRPGQKFNIHEWYLDERRVVSTVMAQIDKFGIPFLDRYSDLGEIKRRLESNSPSDWFSGLNSERRACLLASIALLGNDRAEALRRVDAALEERKNKRSEKRWLLEQLRKRIESRSP